MKSHDEILKYLNKRHDRADYQVLHSLLEPWIYIHYPNDILLLVDTEDRRIAFDFDWIEVMELKEMDGFLQQLRQAIEFAGTLEKFLQSP